MYKQAAPPLLGKSENISSLQVDGLFKGSSGGFNWNEKYNQGDAYDVTGQILPDPNFPLLSITDIDPVYINYQEQPFNYIELTATQNIIRPLAINYIPTVLLYVYVNAPYNLIISPQTPNSSTFDATNNYTLPANSLSLVHVKPSVTSVLRSSGESQDQMSYTTLENEQITVSSIQLT